MKKTKINKLVLRRETVKALLASELGRALGGNQVTCPFDSRPVSGCIIGVQGVPPPEHGD